MKFLKLFFYGLILNFFLWSCRYFSKPVGELREAHLYRCGRYQNRLFVREVLTEEYPDLGILLAYADLIGLSDAEKKAVEEKAKMCYSVCEVLLQEMYIMQDKIKDTIMRKEKQNILPDVSEELNQLEQKKKHWLKFHTRCYQEGLKLVNPKSLAEWQWIEDDYRPLPILP